MLLILDTNVISEMMRPVPSEVVAQWYKRHASDEFATTIISYAEVYAGLALLPDGKRKQHLLQCANDLFDNEFAGRIHEFDLDAASQMALVNAQRSKAGMSIGFPNACIAAIAKVQNATIVTRDTGGFAQTGIQVVNPWFDI